MILTFIPEFSLTASAESLTVSGGGTGIAGDPYKIANLADLEAFCEYINDGNGSGEYFKLTDNIDMSDKYGADKSEGGTSWTPIGVYSKPFNGIFDGGGFTISGLYIKYVAGDYTGYKGLFREIDTEGDVKNLTVSGSISGYETVGGIAGYNKGVISNCHNKCTVNGTRSDVGGIVGQNSSGSIENCDNAGAISGVGSIGGIVGQNVASGSIENCYNTGTVSGSNRVGGIAGNDYYGGTFENCYNAGTVSGSGEYIGGIVGYHGSSGSSVEGCYYLDTCGAEGQGTAKTEDAFNSGEVAYLLQNGQDTQTWGQKLSDGADAYPVLTSDTSKKVLKVTFATQANEAYDAKYTNPDGTVEMPETPVKDNYTFEKWAKTQNADGDKFDEKTQVTEDITVYAVGHDHFGGDSADITLSATYGYEAPITVNLDEHMKYANKSVASEDKFTYEISDKGDTGASIVSDNTLSVPTGLDADDYTITVTAHEKAPQYSIMSVDSYGTDDVTLTVSVSIERAASSVVSAPAAKDLTYDGTAQELVTAGETADGTMQYATEQEGEYSSTVPMGKEAKGYTIWYKVVGDGNHNDLAPQSIQAEIKKAYSVTDVDNAEVTYGDKLTLTASVSKKPFNGIGLTALADKVDFYLGETPLGSADVSYTDELKDSGTATLEITADKRFEIGANTIRAEYGGSVDLAGSEKDSIVVTANKKPLEYSVSAEGKVYDENTAIDVTLTPTNNGEDDVTLTAKGAVSSPNAGSYGKVNLTEIAIGGGDAQYYSVEESKNDVSVDVPIEIAKAEGTASVTMADYKCGDESVNPISSSDTNGTESVTYSYARRVLTITARSSL